MRSTFLPFSRPSITEDEIRQVGDVLRSGWITTGPKCAEFEKRFCEFTVSQHAVALTSATAGMHLALHALGIKAGDEVITPAMTWVSTVNLIMLCGATPVFVDVDRDTLMATPEATIAAITGKTKLIVPVHYAGAAADVEPVRQLAKDRGIAIIEDTAHAVGTYFDGVHVGSRGSSIFSFHPIKNLTTGEGGMFCSNDASLIERIRRLKFHGLGVDAFDRVTQGRAPQAQVLEAGFKYNMPDISAVLGISQLARLEEMNARRAALAAYYRERLAEVPELFPLGDPKYPMKHAWHLFIVRVDTDKARVTRDEFMQELKAKNIGTGLHFRAVHVQQFYANQLGIKRGSLPNTEWNSDRICSLPLFPDMSRDDVDDVIVAIKEVLSAK